MSSLLRTLRGLPRLVTAGTSVVVMGAAGDLVFHLSGGTELSQLVGADGYRAHLVTFAGMVISVIGLIVRAARTQTTYGGSRKCPTVHS